MKTVIFEKKYGVDIDEFKTTNDVDTFLEKKLGRPLKVIDVPVERVIKIDIDAKIDAALDELEKR